MGLLGTVFGLLTWWLVLPDLRPLYLEMDFIHQLMFLFMHLFDRVWKWYNAPVFVGLVYLEIRRTLHQKYNLIAVLGHAQTSHRVPAPHRCEVLKYLDHRQNHNGSETTYYADGETFFGRNMEPQLQKTELLDPHPSVVATKLLSRTELQDDGKQFNMLAAVWINFMIHDWIDHLENLTEEDEIKAPSSVAAQCPLKSFKFYPTKDVPADNGLIGHINTRTPWWDASVIYGSTKEAQLRVRTFENGKLKIRSDGWLVTDTAHDLPISGDIRNQWAGVSAMQSLFIAEHNMVCDVIKKEHPGFSDEELFQRARAVTAAVLAKIHTIDWTPQLLKNNVMLAAMRANWYGLLGKWFKDTIGTTPISLLSGLVGMKEPVDHGVPYSLTEEFTSVYRLHPLLPEQIALKDIKSSAGNQHTPPTVEEIPMPALVGSKGNDKALTLGLKAILTSLGHQSAGSLTLFNYPTWMRQVVPQNRDGTNRPDPVDLASLEIFRDRERSIARYNQFRRSMMMPTIRKWEDLTQDKEILPIIRELYGNNLERLDLLVGLLLEKKPPGFAISETAFFIFVIMASRRLEADPMFTKNFNEEVYTKEGFKWVNTTEGLKDVLRRHHPELVGDWMTSTSAFSVWNEVPEQPNPVPLYLRWGAASPSASVVS